MSAKTKTLDVSNRERTTEARWRVRSIVDQLLHSLDVMGRDGLWECEIERNTPRNSELLNTDESITCDDRTGGEVHTFAHQVASDTAVFALKPLANGLYRPAGTLCSSYGQTRCGVIKHCNHVVLQEVDVLLHSMQYYLHFFSDGILDSPPQKLFIL